MTPGEAIQIFDYAGVVVFALSGALAAARSRLDPFGFVVIGVVTGVGGGSMRDVLLDSGPVFWIADPGYLVAATAAALAGWFLAPKLESRIRTLIWCDAVGLALFAVLGAQKALSVGASPSVAVVMGVMSATFGGLLRDVICNELP
ncbi:MAG: TRIC cation channel family protein, partial [Pseudomonadota bacterium]